MFTLMMLGAKYIVKVDRQCFPDVEFLILRCLPYYLPRALGRYDGVSLLGTLLWMEI